MHIISERTQSEKATLLHDSNYVTSQKAMDTAG